MSNKKEKFTELDVEKLNIVNRNGKVKLTLFNQENIPPAIMDGQDILPGHRQSDPISGMMFYNSEGDECGGLIYGNEINEDGNVSAGASLTFDQYKQDQVVQVHYSEKDGEGLYGFSVYDRPDTPLSEIIEKVNEIKSSNLSEEDKSKELDKVYSGNAPRAFMGKEQNGDMFIKLMDSMGRQRIRMVVDKNDVPRMEFLNENGEVTYKLPPEE